MDFYYYFMKSSVKPDEGVINGVLRIDGNESVPISTRIKTKKIHWNAADQCFEGKGSAQKEALKKLFEDRMKSIRDDIAQMQPGEAIDPDDILKLHRADKKKTAEAMSPKQKANRRFLEHFRAYIKNQQELVSAGRLEPITVTGYTAKRNRIAEFLSERKISYLMTDRFDEKLLLEFRHWLVLRGHEDSTIAKYERLIKTVSQWAYKKGLSMKKPLDDFEILSVEEKDPISLETFELDKLEKIKNSGELNQDLCVTIDIFRFCAETSLSYTDYCTLNDNMMSVAVNGTKWIKRYRQKSDKQHRIPLTPKALEIIDVYGGLLSTLPRKSNYRLNVGIRKVIKIAGIDKYLTFHGSRKSAANDMLNNKKMRETTIKAIMGWAGGSKELSRYARISDESIEEEFMV
jgi:integrase